MPDSREHEIRGIREDRRPDRSREIRRKNDLLETAKTPWGQRIFRRWLYQYRGQPFEGNSKDAYRLGLRMPGDELEKELKAALPRELFLEILYPEKEE